MNVKGMDIKYACDKNNISIDAGGIDALTDENLYFDDSFKAPSLFGKKV